MCVCERERGGRERFLGCLVIFKQGSKTKFLDTLSLHACTSGQTTRQKVLWKSRMSKAHTQSRSRPWFNVSSPNGLAEVHWLHISQGGRRRVSKDRRDVFVKGTVQDVRDDFQVSIKIIYKRHICVQFVFVSVYSCAPIILCQGKVGWGGWWELTIRCQAYSSRIILKKPLWDRELGLDGSIGTQNVRTISYFTFLEFDAVLC